MVKRKKKTAPDKSQIKDSQKELVEQARPVIQEENEGELPAFGILPSRDLKKNLGCG